MPAAIDNDDELYREPTPVDAPGQPRKRKRSRSTTARLPEPHSDGAEDLVLPQSKSRKSNGVGSGDKTVTHRAGAIVRVHLQNFVTYTNVTFHPGPSLNMVIGPNGTGKSTLVCAICLGLGWPPRLLGRSKNVEDYIKHGSQNAIVEIELQGLPGKVNPVIKRRISHNKNNSGWWVNGSPSNEKNARASAEAFNIQIDNLCQFLPQDRVVEFAMLKPVDKLAATIRAAAPARMLEQLEELKSLRQGQKEAEGNVTGQREQLNKLEARQNAQRQEVERVREREKILGEVEFLEKTRPVAAYKDAERRLKDARDITHEADNRLEQLTAQVEPMTRGTREKEEAIAEITGILQTRQKVFDRLEAECKTTLEKKEKLSIKIKEATRDRKVESQSQTQRKQRIAQVKARIADLEKQLQNEPPAFDGAEINERIRNKRREKNDIDSRRADLEDSHKTLNSEINEKRRRIDTASRQIASLQTEAGQREGLLRKTRNDVAEAWKHIQADASRIGFRDRVYGPVVLECSCTSDKWAPAIESLFQGEQYAFTVTNKEDFRKLSDELHSRKEGKPWFGNVSIRLVTAPIDSFKEPIPKESFARLGIEGFALDYISGPDVMRAFLCSERSFHKVALLAREETDEQFNLLSESGLDSWTSQAKMTRLTRRQEYNAVSTRTSLVGERANFWASKPVDNAQLGTLQEDIEGWKSEIAELQSQIASNTERAKDLKQQMRSIDDEIETAEEEKAKLQHELTRFKALPSKIATEQAKLTNEEDEQQKAQDRLLALHEQSVDAALGKSQVAIDFARIMPQMRQYTIQIIEANVVLIRAKSDLAQLKDKNAEIENSLAEHREIRKKCIEDGKKIKVEVKTRLKEMQANFARHEGLSDKFYSLSEEEKNRTLEDIDRVIEDLRNRLELHRGGNPMIVQEYEERGRTIQRARQTISEAETLLATVNEQIDSIRSVWEPELDAIIAEISDAFGSFFARIKCAGEIGILKAGDQGKDFDQWAVHVKVKFRENEALSVLDSHRQSGGERAVSTMFYLMALQRLSQAPFRVVDEINQGMDPRNERCVHEMMVDIACGDAELGTTGGQYFLVTPKLLTGLKYRQGIKVHCIASGEYMPEDPEELQVARQVKRALAAGMAALAAHTGRAVAAAA